MCMCVCCVYCLRVYVCKHVNTAEAAQSAYEVPIAKAFLYLSKVFLSVSVAAAVCVSGLAAVFVIAVFITDPVGATISCLDS